MKSAEQIRMRIEELRGQWKKANDNPARHRRGQKGHLGNLSTPRIKKLEGEILGLEWVLEPEEASASTNF